MRAVRLFVRSLRVQGVEVGRRWWWVRRGEGGEGARSGKACLDILQQRELCMVSHSDNHWCCIPES